MKRNLYHCDHYNCNKIFKDRSGLRKHCDSKHRHNCPHADCDHTLSTMDEFLKHMREHAEGEEESPTFSSDYLPCDIVDATKSNGGGGSCSPSNEAKILNFERELANMAKAGDPAAEVIKQIVEMKQQQESTISRRLHSRVGKRIKEKSQLKQVRSSSSHISLSASQQFRASVVGIAEDAMVKSRTVNRAENIQNNQLHAISLHALSNDQDDEGKSADFLSFVANMSEIVSQHGPVKTTSMIHQTPKRIL